MLMKWLIRLAFPALGVLVALIVFGLNDPTETTSEPAGTEANVDIPSFEGLVPSPIPTEGPDIVFKWQDSDGSWHYADTPRPRDRGMRWPLNAVTARPCAHPRLIRKPTGSHPTVPRSHCLPTPRTTAANAAAIPPLTHVQWHLTAEPVTFGASVINQQ